MRYGLKVLTASLADWLAASKSDSNTSVVRHPTISGSLFFHKTNRPRQRTGEGYTEGTAGGVDHPSGGVCLMTKREAKIQKTSAAG